MAQDLFMNQNFFWTQNLFDSILFKTQFFCFDLIKILPKLNTLDLSLVVPILKGLFVFGVSFYDLNLW